MSVLDVVRGTLLSVAGTVLTGCLVVPTPEHDLLSGHGEIIPGDEQVLLTLGEPGLSLDYGRILVYEWSVTRAYWFVVFGGGYSGYAGGGQVGKQYVFLIEFDDRGMLKRYERLPVALFKSLASVVDEWTSDDEIKLVDLATRERMNVLRAEAMQRYDVDVPVQDLQGSLASLRATPLRVVLPSAISATKAPYWVGFKTPGNDYAMASVFTTEPPDTVLGRGLAHAWTGSDLHVVEDDGDVEIHWNIRKFSVSSPVTLLTWNAQCILEVDVSIERDGKAQEVRYQSTGTVRPLFGPGPDDFAQALVKCVRDVSSQLAADLLVP
jgi:hypothetical protein